MQIEFLVRGPFQIPMTKGGLDQTVFWQAAEVDAFKDDWGCYVFALQKVKGDFLPQYVGMTKVGFKKEVFNPSNLKKYNRVMQNSDRKWKPTLFLILSERRAKKSFIGDLESFLIQVGSARNQNIANLKGVHRPKWKIRGVTGRQPGKPTQAARTFRKAMGIK